MKKRQGFVSNSSTTSFCIYGTQLEITTDTIINCFKYIKANRSDDYKQMLEKVKKDWLTKTYMAKRVYILDMLEHVDTMTDQEKDQLDEFLDDDPIEIFTEIVNLNYWHGPDYGNNIYLGRSWDSITDDETGKQFKESIEESLMSVFGDSVTCGTHEESWRDG